GTSSTRRDPALTSNPVRLYAILEASEHARSSDRSTRQFTTQQSDTYESSAWGPDRAGITVTCPHTSQKERFPIGSKPANLAATMKSNHRAVYTQLAKQQSKTPGDRTKRQATPDLTPA
ncbi:hypothetical protein BaRGS_00021248, partial [Batillaria attramentaria]